MNSSLPTARPRERIGIAGLFTGFISRPVPVSLIGHARTRPLQANLDHGLQLDAISTRHTRILHDRPAAKASLTLPPPRTRRHACHLRPSKRRDRLGFTKRSLPMVTSPEQVKKLIPTTSGRSSWRRPSTATNQAACWPRPTTGPQEIGVTVWEMWNEPDLPFFWDASLSDYARLLKVGYLAAKHADPNAAIMFGGLAMWQNARLLRPACWISLLATPWRSSQDYFHDIMAIHNYSRSRNAPPIMYKS